MSGGPVAIRGYLVQTLIGLLEALDSKRAWRSVSLEPNIDSEKVDILWEYPHATKAVQVKSLQNPFGKRDIERWAADLGAWKEADEYELVLVGTPGSSAVARMRRVGKVAVLPPKNLDLLAFKEQAAYRLERFLKSHGLPAGDSSYQERLAGSLAERLATLATKSEPLTRAGLADLLTRWISQTDESEALFCVFISSTAEDLKCYREAAREAALGAQMLPTMMEYFVASGDKPPLGACLSRVSEADLLVVLVAHRYGWVPEDQPGSEHKSITWLECEEAVKAGQEVLAFLVDEECEWPEELTEEHQVTRAIRDGMGEGKLMELAKSVRRNVKRLRDFKAWLSGRGIRATFTTPEDLRRCVAEALHEWRRRHLRLVPVTLERPRRADPAGYFREPTIPPGYVEWLKQQCADVDLLGLKMQHGQAVKLNNVYIPLTTLRGQPDALDPISRLSDEKQPQLLLDLLDKDSLYVSGAPGSGKSIFCRWVAWLACEGKMPEPEIQPPKEYAETFPKSLAGRLPVLIRLRDFWTCLPRTPGCREMTEAEFRASLAAWVATKQQGGLTWDIVEPHLERGSLFLILDGMDEVPLTHGDARNPCQPRAMLFSALLAAVHGWTRRGNRLVLTGRPYGAAESDARKLPFPWTPLGDLDEPMRRLLVQRWLQCLIDQPKAAADAADQMLDHVAQRTDIGPLTANPMLLTAMCVFYHQGRRLPQDRYDLYDRIVDNVLFNRFPEDRGVIDPVRNRLAVVAYGMHTGEGLGEERITPQAETTYAEIDRMIQTHQDQTPWSEPGYTGAVEAREQLLGRTGLLLPRGENRAGFYHFTFQDFLAAQRLLEMHEDSLFEVFCERANVPEWRSTLSFVFASQLANHPSPARSILLLGRLVDALTEDTLGLSVVVAECLQILLKRGLRLKSDLEDKFRQYYLSAIEREVTLRDRFELGLVWGHLGDPRIVVDLRDRDAYVEIPAGRYPIGDNELHKRGWGLAEERFEVQEPFLISRYPVTNSQYAVFIEAGGYQDRGWWSREGWRWLRNEKVTEPRFWQDAKWNTPNQPVVGVSLWEAEAFAKWAGGKLPSEKQWEAAARGADGFEYPWGNKWKDGICNSHEAGLGVTSPVGTFPRSRSAPFGLQDMAGNVLEWCRDKFGMEWPQASLRVVRGGGWVSRARYCRSAFRGGQDPAYRDTELGFRVAAVVEGIKEDEAVASLAKALKNEDATVRSYAAEALGTIGPYASRAVPALVDALKDKEDAVRRAAAVSLRNIGPSAREAVSALIEALYGSSSLIRRSAAEALGSIGGDAKEAVSALIGALKDQDRSVRSSVAEALGNVRIHADEAVSALVETLGDKDEMVRQSGEAALDRIGDATLVAVAERIVGSSPSVVDRLLRLLAERSPVFLAERQCTDARIVEVDLSGALVIRIETGMVAVTEMALERDDSFGWDIQLTPIDATEPSERMPLRAVSAKRVERRVVELTIDAADLPWGLYLTTVRFLVKGREHWRVNQTLSNKEPENPYIAGPPIREPLHFFGREDAMRDVAARLRTYSVILLGPRRSGKTSFLYQLSERSKNDWVTVLLDLHIFAGDSTSEIISGITTAVYRECVLDATGPPPADLEELGNRLRESGIRRLLLLVDEMAVLAGHPAVGHKLRAVSKWRNPETRVVVAGTASDLDKVIGAALDIGSDPLNEFPTYTLKEISRQHAQDLLEKPVLGFYRYKVDALDMLLDLGAGRPFFLNHLAHQTLKAVRSQKGRIVRLEHVQAGRREALYELGYRFKEFVGELDGHTRRALPKLISASDEPVPEVYAEALYCAGLTVGPRHQPRLCPLFVESWKLRSRKEE